MKSFHHSKFFYSPVSKQFFATTQELGEVREESFTLVGKNESKVFNYVGGDETFDEIAGECLAYHFKSECGKFYALINIV